MKLEDNFLIDIMTAPIQLSKNTINFIRYEKNLKTAYRYIVCSNLLSIVFSFIVNDFSTSFYYHIGSILFVLYIIYITNSSAHKQPYKDLYKSLKSKINNKNSLKKEEVNEK